MTTSPMQAAPDFSGSLTHGFLLVEPAALVHVPELSALEMRPCTPRVLAHREELMPQLIDLAALNDEERAPATECWMAETHAERPPVVCAWLDSEADADTIAEHVARHLVGPGADGEAVFWRYYDPRVLALTLAIFDPKQRLALLGPIRAWHFAWAGHRWSVTSSGAEATGADPPLGWPRREQWPRVNCSAAADKVLRRLPGMSFEHTTRLPAMLDQAFTEMALNKGTNDDDALVERVSQRLRNEFALGAAI